VPSWRARSMPASAAGGAPSTKSSGEVVTMAQTSVSPTTPAATSPYSDSSATRPLAPESVRISSSSRALYIGLTETMIAPAFHVATIAITNCGTFCR
jgi:hypothetical protein